LESFKNRKAGGSDRITAEVLKEKGKEKIFTSQKGYNFAQKITRPIQKQNNVYPSLR